MSKLGDALVSGLLVAAVVTTAASVAYLAFFRSGPSVFIGGAGMPDEPQQVEDWERGLQYAYPVGGLPDAPTKMLVLVDLQCPACRAFHSTVSQLLAERHQDIQVFYLNYPLTYHRFARGAARAAHCAFELGKLPQWVDAVFAKQDSLGLKSWGSYALDATIRDTTRVASCAHASASIDERIDAGRRFGASISDRGIATPAVLINGWWYPSTPTKADIMSLIQESQ